MIYGYARVSSAGQAIDGNSLEAQSELLKANGAQKIFSDVYTGTKLHRPELDKLMTEIQPGDTLIVAKLDRIARSAKNGLELIDQGKKIASQRPDYKEGRKPTEYDRNLFDILHEQVEKRILTVTDAAKQLGVTRQTWYRIAGQNR